MAVTIAYMDEPDTKTSLGTRLLAGLVLVVAAWVLVKIVIGAVMAVAWTVAAIVAVIAVLWAINKLV